MLALLLWFTIRPRAVGWPPAGSVRHAVTVTSFAADFEEEQPASTATDKTAMLTIPTRRLIALLLPGEVLVETAGTERGARRTAVRCDVCFAPQADLVGGVVVGAIGVDAFRHLRGRNNHLLLAGVPLLLGAHQLDEAFVWWGIEGHVPHDVGRVALWIYLLIAFVVLPIFLPLAVLALEPTAERRWRMAPFIALGAGVSTVLLVAMLRAPINATEHPYHVAYTIDINHGGVVVAFYVVAVCGALLFSGYRHIAIWGLANLVAVAILARITLDGLASLWCGYAAISAGAIALHMRYAAPHRSAPYRLS